MKKGISTKIVVYTVILLIIVLLGLVLIFKGKEIGLDIVEKIREMLEEGR